MSKATDESWENTQKRTWSRNNVEKLQIVAVDGFGGGLEAQYNPKEVQIDKSVTWNDASKQHFIYTKDEPRTVALELLYDVFEFPGVTLDSMIATLNQMATPMKRGSHERTERRPPVLKLGNGPVPGMLCVLESVSVKVMMFDKLNRPVRATVNLKLREITPDEREGLMGGRAPVVTEGRWYRAQDPRNNLTGGTLPPPPPPKPGER